MGLPARHRTACRLPAHGIRRKDSSSGGIGRRPGAVHLGIPGLRIHEDTGVTGILTGGGRITGVETDRGAVRCDAIALCAGLWSRKVASMAGAEVPVWPCEHFYLLTQPIDGIEGNLPTLSDHDRHL